MKALKITTKLTTLEIITHTRDGATMGARQITGRDFLDAVRNGCAEMTRLSRIWPDADIVLVDERGQTLLTELGQ